MWLAQWKPVSTSKIVEHFSKHGNNSIAPNAEHYHLSFFSSNDDFFGDAVRAILHDDLTHHRLIALT